MRQRVPDRSSTCGLRLAVTCSGTGSKTKRHENYHGSLCNHRWQTVTRHGIYGVDMPSRRADAEYTYAAATEWVNRALRNEDSLFTPGKAHLDRRVAV